MLASWCTPGRVHLFKFSNIFISVILLIPDSGFISASEGQIIQYDSCSSSELVVNFIERMGNVIRRLKEDAVIASEELEKEDDASATDDTETGPKSASFARVDHSCRQETPPVVNQKKRFRLEVRWILFWNYHGLRKAYSSISNLRVGRYSMTHGHHRTQ